MNKSKYKTTNDIKVEKRTETILVKVTPTEQEQIKKLAEEAGYGGKIAPYIRNQSLRPDANLSSGKLRQEIALLMCRHAQLVEKMDDQALRKHFIEWEETRGNYMAVYKVINKAGNYRNEDAAECLLSYITSPLKTKKDGIFGGAVIPEIAALSMNTVTELFHNDTDTGPRLRHSILSFSPDEGLLPADVKKIASEAIKFYKDEYQIVAAVHEDREHPHIHFAMNTTSYLDGSKYHGTKSDYYNFLKYLNQAAKPYRTIVKAVTAQEDDEL